MIRLLTSIAQTYDNSCGPGFIGVLLRSASEKGGYKMLRSWNGWPFIGMKHEKFFNNRATFELRIGARNWLKENGKIPLEHGSNTWQIPAHLVDEFNKLFVK